MEEIKEEWRPVVGYEGLYEVSNKGKVVSLNYRKQKGYRKELKYSNIKGYIQVDLMKKGKKKHTSVHRLLAMAFIPNPQNLPCVNHKDENPSNNNIDNLEWCTYKYNTNYGTALQRRRKAQQHPVIQLTRDGEFVARYQSVTEATIAVGAAAGDLSAVCSGRHISAKGFLWRFEDEVRYKKAVQKRATLDKQNLENKQKADIKKSYTIKQYDLNGNFIKEFPSCTIASQELQIHSWCIRKVCCGTQKNTNGFIFKYEKK